MRAGKARQPPCDRGGVKASLSELGLNNGHAGAAASCPFGAKNGLVHRSKYRRYSITSSARASSVGGIVRPSDFAVFRLITRLNLVGCLIGKSAGLAPFRILST